MKKKIFFILPPVLIAIITWIWLFYEDGRWYTYREEWPWTPLLFVHLILPLFYFIMFIIRLIRHINKNTRSESDVFYIVSSIIMTVICTVGLFVFLIFTSGA